IRSMPGSPAWRARSTARLSSQPRPSGLEKHTSFSSGGAGQFIWRAGEPSVEGYVAASDPRRDGVAAGY
ncbi:hypothetical protein QMO14_30925, partial [Variovorax sp. CAN2819]|uniref:hypothetical protein n=1 Tax=Variovorax sp. CAN15 TaxID=3046727 RepID=UPI002649B236